MVEAAGETTCFRLRQLLSGSASSLMGKRRLWKSVKYEEVYLKAYDSVSEARAGIGRYFEFYNGRRPHSSLGGMTPDEFYIRALPTPAAA